MFFTPKHVKEGRHYRHALKRLIHYKKDILPAKDLAVLQELLARLQQALKSRHKEEIFTVRDEIERAVGRIAPPPKDAGWRENVEVFLVAIVIAAGVRAYFLQPFKIPTGSMQPTLFGIVGTPTVARPPNPISRAIQLVLFGRHYIDVTAKEADIIVDLEEATYLNFFTFTTIVGEKNSYTVFAPRDTLYRDFGVQPRRSYQQGETIARGFIQTGDQVFVDKMSYHFANPNRGQVFVFKTNGIQTHRNRPAGRRRVTALHQAIGRNSWRHPAHRCAGSVYQWPQGLSMGIPAGDESTQRLSRVFEHAAISVSLDAGRNLHRPRPRLLCPGRQQLFLARQS